MWLAPPEMPEKTKPSPPTKGDAIMRTVLLSCCVILAGVAAAVIAPPAHSGDQNKPDPAALERSRKTVRMLDDVYKSAIVLITDKYVKDKRDYPAGRAAIKWFADISRKGSHEVRLIDATGEPYGQANVANDDFDREGVKQLKAGKDYYDQLIVKEGKPYLRAITPVPVVMQKCTMCHEHYQNVKKGAPVGALTYTIPIE
jgi:hypothetical protein